MKPSDFKHYAEYMGGLGDVLLRLHTSPWYASLENLAPDQKAAVVLMSHNAGAAEIWQWHPNKDRIHVFDLGFNTKFHPWENLEWRRQHDLPDQGPCPPPHDGSGIKFYPSTNDLAVLDHVKFPFAVFAPVAGTSERTFPREIQLDIQSRLLAAGIVPVLVGRSRYGIPEHHPGSISLVDRLSVPGTIELIRRSSIVISAHTSTLHAAWFAERPVFLLYPKWVSDVFKKHGSVGYFFGADRKTTDHMEFPEYAPARLEKLLETMKCDSTS